VGTPAIGGDVQPGMKTRIVLTSILLAVAACGAAETTSTEPAAAGADSVTIVENGGCAMMGPNCATWTLHPDGSFTLSRTGEEGVVEEAAIDPATAAELFDEIASTDLDTFVDGLGPGECLACVDGIDTRVEITMPGGLTVLDSAEVGFDDSALFVLVDEARSAMAAAAELPIEQR
jgi:hypothetical protein